MSCHDGVVPNVEVGTHLASAGLFRGSHVSGGGQLPPFFSVSLVCYYGERWSFFSKINCLVLGDGILCLSVSLLLVLGLAFMQQVSGVS